MFSCGLVSPPKHPSLRKGLHQWPAQAPWACPGALVPSLLPRRGPPESGPSSQEPPGPPSGLQDLSDPASVLRGSLAPLKREAAHLHGMARGFPWQPALGTCLLPGLESRIVLSLIRVLKIESSPFCPLPFIFNPQVPQPFLLLRGLSPGTFWKMSGKLVDGER